MPLAEQELSAVKLGAKTDFVHKMNYAQMVIPKFQGDFLLWILLESYQYVVFIYGLTLRNIYGSDDPRGG